MTPGLSPHAVKILQEENLQLTKALLRRSQARLGTVEGAQRCMEIISLVENYFHFSVRKKEIQILFNVRAKNKLHPQFFYNVLHS